LISGEEIKENLETLQFLTDDFLESSQLILGESIDMEKLDPQTSATCYAFWERREELASLQEKLSNYHGIEKDSLHKLLQAMQKIEKAPFVDQYQTFHQLKRQLENKITSESSSQVELYLNLLIKNRNAIKNPIESNPLEHVMGHLTSPETKLCFYCMVKYQDDIQALAKSMDQDNIFVPGLKLQDLKGLSELSEKTLPLKRNTEIPLTPFVSSQCATHSLSEARAYLHEARLLIESSKKDSETMTSIQELLWKSALGFLQNSKPEEASQSLALACQHLPNQASFGSTDLDDRLRKEPQYGTHLSSLGTGYNKDQSVHLTHCLMDHKPMVTMDFALNGHAVLALKTFREAFDFPDTAKLMQVLPDKFCAKITIKERENHHYLAYTDGTFTTESQGYKLPSTPQTVIEFEGIGRVILGNCPEVKCIDNMVFVEAIPSEDTEKTLSNIQTMLTALGVPPVLVTTRKADHQRKPFLMYSELFILGKQL